MVAGRGGDTGAVNQGLCHTRIPQLPQRHPNRVCLTGSNDQLEVTAGTRLAWERVTVQWSLRKWPITAITARELLINQSTRRRRIDFCYALVGRAHAHHTNRLIGSLLDVARHGLA
ncbi:hypothetical protein RRG08_022893 [Elysia crispata]|uniref:Uncharacterized protein n=1 Tax=Elysia crispata TaxID=231223 RepID=A0AAE0XN38_9GAST|nr:hypothetical protein RRG08_022893 [Elysia crispata]